MKKPKKEKEEKAKLVVHEPRIGKTKRDRASGAHDRNYANKLARADWNRNINASQSNFPYETCNGKRNRRFIIRRGERVEVRYKGMM